MERYDVLYARNNLSKLVSRVEAGEEIEISRRGKPVARLIAATPKRGLTGAEMVAWLEANPLPETHHKSREEIDAIIRDIEEGRRDR